MICNWAGAYLFWTVLSFFTGTLVDTRSCKEKFRVLGTHSACLSKSTEAKDEGVDSVDRQLIVDKHNQYRGLVVPSASDMLKMSWDYEVALIAQAWAENCFYGHDNGNDRRIPGRFSVGQNIGSGYRDWETIIKAWYDEYTMFNYGGRNNFKEIGHYTQMVWAKTNKIGCGFAKCNFGPYYVCDYAPAGNLGSVINTPYKLGSSCSDCPGNCVNNLCDCGTKSCENDGTMVLRNCSCSCKHEFHVGSECKLNCENLKEPNYCGTGGFDKAGCKIYSNVPGECPSTCDVCPYGGYKYHDNISRASDCHSFTSAVYLITLLLLWL